MKTLAKTAVLALSAFGLAGAVVTPAFAQEFERTNVSVSYTDLDLSTAKGQKILEQRVEKAARHACRTTALSTGTRIINQNSLSCLAKARSEAKRQVAAVLANEQRGG